MEDNDESGLPEFHDDGSTSRKEGDDRSRPRLSSVVDVGRRRSGSLIAAVVDSRHEGAARLSLRYGLKRLCDRYLVSWIVGE